MLISIIFVFLFYLSYLFKQIKWFDPSFNDAFLHILIGYDRWFEEKEDRMVNKWFVDFEGGKSLLACNLRAVD